MDKPIPKGPALLHDPALNKGTAFTEEERDALGIRGLLPPRVFSEDAQLGRIMDAYRRKPNDLERYIYLTALQDRNETLFYRVLLENIDEMMPIVYTPTVGDACRQFAHIWRRGRGLFVSAEDHGRVRRLVGNWPVDDVRVIVVTDGERILGLGDLGANGMGIPIGKLSLYTACAGIHPSKCLPVTLDVGTDNEALRNDPLYIGLLRARLRGEAYDALVDEFVAAVHERFPRALIQFEDFGNRNAFRLLRKYRDQVCTFNDDIQGTAAVALAGIYSALRITGGALADQRFLFLGAGEAGTGIADLIVSALEETGMGSESARERCFFVDSHGLVVKSREDLAEHKLPYAHELVPLADLESAVEALRPTVLIGVSGKPQTFSEAVLHEMAELNERPIVFALSNPTSQAECTAEQAYRSTGGRAIFASGSPFAPVDFEGRTFVPGQGNNAYVFPGIGLGIVASEAKRIPNPVFLAAAKALANEIDESSLEEGCIYPPLKRMRQTSFAVARAVCQVVYEEGLTDAARPDDLDAHIRSHVYEPVYRSYV